jgi:hypothetical protein
MEEIKQANKYSEIWLETMNISEETEDYKKVAQKYGVTVNDIRYNNNILNKKLKKLFEDGSR